MARIKNIHGRHFYILLDLKFYVKARVVFLYIIRLDLSGLGGVAPRNGKHKRTQKCTRLTIHARNFHVHHARSLLKMLVFAIRRGIERSRERESFVRLMKDITLYKHTLS